MKIYLFLWCLFFLAPEFSFAGVHDLWVRAQAVRQGVALEAPRYKAGDIIVEKPYGSSWQGTFITKVISVDAHEVTFLQSKVNSGVPAERYIYTVNLATGQGKSSNDFDVIDPEMELIVKKVEKKSLETIFGQKNCSIIAIDVRYDQESNWMDSSFTFCEAIPGSGVIDSDWLPSSPGYELKEYLEN